jgi:hypothetical protein
MSCVKRIPLLIALLLACLLPGQSQERMADVNDGVVTGSLTELRTRRHVLLLVRRSAVIDSRGQARSILNEVYRAGAEPPQHFARIYNTIAGRLNKYMVKYRSISAVRDISNAEFIVFFNLLEYRWPLGHPYAYGEMFVILNERSGNGQPRIIWKTRKSPISVEDAINELIRDLKDARGEG